MSQFHLLLRKRPATQESAEFERLFCVRGKNCFLHSPIELSKINQLFKKINLHSSAVSSYFSSKKPGEKSKIILDFFFRQDDSRISRNDVLSPSKQLIDEVGVFFRSHAFESTITIFHLGLNKTLDRQKFQ